MTSDLTYREKGRAMFLAAIMVLSVVAMSAAFAGGAAAVDNISDDDFDKGPTYESPDAINGGDIWLGQEVRFGTENDSSANSLSESVYVYEGPSSDDDADRIKTLRSSGGVSQALDSAEDLEAGQEYHLQSDNAEWDGVEFFVSEEQLDVSFSDNTVADDGETTLEFDSDADDGFERASQYVNVTSEDLDAEDIDDLFDLTAEDGLHDNDDVATFEIATGSDITVDFDQINADTGDYDFDFEVTDSLASDNATIEVSDKDSELAFGDGVFSDQRGNMVNITVELDDNDNGFVQLGDAEDDYFSTYAEFEVDDDADLDEVTLQYNTHFPGNNPLAPEDTGWYAPSDDVDINDSEVVYDWSDAPLAAGSYELIVGENWDDGEEQVGDDHDRAQLSLSEKSPPGAPHSEIAPDSITDMEDYEDTTTTESDTVADGDTLIGVVPDLGASGSMHALDNAFGNNNASLGPTAALSGITLSAERTDVPDHEAQHYNSSVSPDAEGTDGTEDNEHPLPIKGINLDDYDGDLYVVIDYEEAGMEVDAQYDATFMIDGNSAYLDDDQDNVEMDMTLSLQEPELTLDPSNGELPAGEADVTGTTNVAPGNEIDTNAIGDGAFSLSEDADVASDGTFAATYDFSGESAGTEFTIDATASGYEVDGDAVEDDIDSVLTEGGSAPAEGIDVSVDHPSEITAGESADVTATVDNHEDEELTVSLEYSIGGETFEEELTVAADDSESVSQSVEGLETGDHDVSATATADDVEDASYSGTLTVSEESSSSDDEDTETDDEDDGDSEGQPGFGVAVALVALLAAAMIALRRQD